MSKHNEHTLKEALQALFSQYNLSDKITETRVLNAWEEMMGKMIANHTRKIFISKSTLFIYVDNPSLKKELTYLRAKIIQLVNDEAGKELVKEVVIR